MILEWLGGDGYSVPLTDEYGVRVLAGTSGLDAVPVVSDVSNRMGDGASHVSTRRPVRQVMLALLFLDEQTRADLSSSMIASARTGAVKGRLAQVDGNGRELTEVLYVGGLEGDSGRDAESTLWTKRVVELHALDPFWYGPSQTLALPTTKETLYSDAATAYSSVETPYDGGGVETLSIQGTADVDGVVTLTGPFTRYSFGTAAGLWTLAAALAAGVSVTVDTRFRSRGPRRADGVLDWTLLDAKSVLQAVPLGGRTVIGATPAGSPTATFTYRPRYVLR